MKPKAESVPMTAAEREAVREVLDRVRQIVGNNSPGWTRRFGHEHLQRVFTPEVQAVLDRLKR